MHQHARFFPACDQGANQVVSDVSCGSSDDDSHRPAVYGKVAILSDVSRESPRVAADFRVSYESIDQLVVAYCSDLSKGGMFLATEHMLPVDAVVRLSLELPEGSSELVVLARVAYTR